MENQIVFGYATVWGIPYRNNLGELCQFERSDCNHALRNPNCKALVSHDHTQEIGTVGDAGLLLRADDHGLLCAISCPWDAAGIAVYSAVRGGRLSQMSLCEKTDAEPRYYLNAGYIDTSRIGRLLEVSLAEKGCNSATAAIAVCDWKRAYLDSLQASDANEKLRLLRQRGIASESDIALAQALARRVSLWRLSRLAWRNRNPSRPPDYLGCPPLTFNIDLTLRAIA